MKDKKDKPEITTQILHCRLSTDELLKYSDQLSCEVNEVASLQAKKAAAASDYKAKIEAKEEIITDLARKVRTKEEDREVECEIVKDWEHKCVRTTRRDTGEVVGERAMTAEEMQRMMFDKDGKPMQFPKAQGDEFASPAAKPEGTADAAPPAQP
jgi:seryl-tRNA synthetase